MLHFFRKYQSYFFAIITFVIIISFSFFGTYNALPSNAAREQVAFRAIDGTEIPRSDLDEMVVFLATDAEDKRLFGGIWGPNFLNDGYIKNDLLQTGLAQILVQAYPSLVERDLETRLLKERRYSLYTHPQAKFLSTEGAWAYFAPALKSHFDALRSAQNAVTPEAFNSRVALFLGEKKFPAPMLRQVLRYQQQQYNWLSPDPNLEHLDLSLFGYHTVDDWFGPRFIRMVAEFTINSSTLAEQKGYQVSKAEALADLMRNAEISYEENIDNPRLGVANSTEYFKEQLRHLNMDQNTAARIWRQVLLARRMFQDIGNANVIDPLTHQQFLAYAGETVSGDLYRLPSALRFNDYRSLQKFEAYLNAIAPSSKESAALLLPEKLLATNEVNKQTPELVQKRYLLQVAQADKKALQNRVSLKEMWNWEVEDKNWERLKTEFPDLGIKKAKTWEERFAVLDSLDDTTRGRIDTTARVAVVDAHPEWIQEALQAAPAKLIGVGLRATGGSSFVAGLNDRKELIQLLDTAPLSAEENPSEQAQKAASTLSQFTADNSHYYRIAVIERAPQEEILTFVEANAEGVLDKLLDKQLEDYYSKNREKSPTDFQNADGSWKPFADVKNQVADRYFEKLLKSIREDYKKGHAGKDLPTTGDWAASARFYAYGRALQEKLKKGEDVALWVRTSEKAEENSERLPLKVALEEQWKWEKAPYEVNRGTKIDSLPLEKEEILALAPEGWTRIYTPVNGDLFFFQAKKKEASGDVTAAYDKIHEGHALLSDAAQRHFMHRVVHELKEKNAISLDYLDTHTESMEQPSESNQDT